MAYFSNGTEGLCYKEKYCFKCVNWTTREGENADGCPIWDLHLMYNSELCNNPDSFLDKLIPRTENRIFNERCKMYLPK